MQQPSGSSKGTLSSIVSWAEPPSESERHINPRSHPFGDSPGVFRKQDHCETEKSRIFLSAIDGFLITQCFPSSGVVVGRPIVRGAVPVTMGRHPRRPETSSDLPRTYQDTSKAGV